MFGLHHFPHPDITYFIIFILICWDFTRAWPAPPAQGSKGGRTVVRSSSTCGPAWWEFFRYYQHVNHNMTMIMANYLSMCRMRTMSSCSAPKASNFSIATRPSVGQSGQLSTCKISNTNVFWIAKVQDTLFSNCTLKKIPCPGKNWSPQRGPRFHHPTLGEFSFQGMKLYKEEPPTWQSCHPSQWGCWWWRWSW